MKQRKQTGFTLVEIAIVLVIIGLLLGGVLKGQAMIASARVKALTNEIKSINTMLFAYQDRFRAIPGVETWSPRLSSPDAWHTRCRQRHVTCYRNCRPSRRVFGKPPWRGPQRALRTAEYPGP
jgi:prepilin-type N-terminal cleavage/methylation domain-containing protein